MPVAKTTSLTILTKQAGDGDMAAQFRLGNLYRTGGDGVTKDPGQAHQWLKRAAEKGHVKAQAALGDMYRNGEGVSADPFRAAEWYQLAADLGNDTEAQFAVGRLYFSGLGLPHDYHNAIKYFERAAEKDHPGAQFLLGAMNQDGWGVNQDLVHAYFWYTLAARQEEKVLKIDPRYTVTVNRYELGKEMNRFQIERAEKMAADWERTHGPVPGAASGKGR